MKPEALVLLGATASKALLGSSFRLTKHRGELLDSTLARVVTATIHPSAILRAPDDESRQAERRAFAEDLGVIGRSPAARSARRSATGWRKSGRGLRPRPVSRSQICSSWARCSSMTPSICSKSAARIAPSVRSWMSITQSGTSGVHRHVAGDLEPEEWRMS